MTTSVKESIVDKYWYSDRRVPVWLRALANVFRIAAAWRRVSYRLHLRTVYRPPVPVIVVGNLNVGGTGKTPLVVWLTNYLKRAGYEPGVVSRGYGGQARQWPQQVRPDSDPSVVGDEPVLLARHCQCPMAVGPDRGEAVKALLAHTNVNVIISDDGLQHYALARDLEIVVIDGERRFGNGRCLPAGPLREPMSRLQRVDFRVVNGGDAQANEVGMRLTWDQARNVRDPGMSRKLSEFGRGTVHAVAGIGNPQRFFSQLRGAKLKLAEHPFDDHHAFTAADLDFGDQRPVLMTEKDAVKCERFAAENHWYLAVEAEMPRDFGERVVKRLEEKIAPRKEKWTANFSTSLSAPSAKGHLSTGNQSKN